MLVCDICGTSLTAEERMKIFHSVIRSKEGTYGEHDNILGEVEYGDVCSPACQVKFLNGQGFVRADVVVHADE